MAGIVPEFGKRETGAAVPVAVVVIGPALVGEFHNPFSSSEALSFSCGVVAPVRRRLARIGRYRDFGGHSNCLTLNFSLTGKRLRRKEIVRLLTEGDGEF